jgi:hypothetical protein
MKNKTMSRASNWAGVALAGVLALMALVSPAGAVQSVRRAPAVAAPAAEAQPALSGNYVGGVDLAYSLPGVFTDTLPPPNPLPEVNLGQIDLGLMLTQAGTTVTGYVELTTTLVFTGEHTVGAVAYGPAVMGTLNGAKLTLISEKVSHKTAAGQTLERQFWLEVDPFVPEADNLLSGKYRETVWGYGPQPMTMVGTFTLQGPMSQGPAPLAAQLLASATVGMAPFQVYFTDQSSGDPTGWQWSFGDGDMSTQQNPVHTYTVPGTYTVSLTVTRNGETNTQTRTDYIRVLQAGDQRLVLPLVFRR